MRSNLGKRKRKKEKKSTTRLVTRWASCMAASPATLLASYVDLTVSIITNDGRNVVVRSRLHVCAAFVTLSVSPRPPRIPVDSLRVQRCVRRSLCLSASTAGVHRRRALPASRCAPYERRAGAVRVPCGSAALRHSFSSSLPPPPHSHHSPTHSLHPHLLFPSLPHHQHLHTTTNPPPPLPLRRAC